MRVSYDHPRYNEIKVLADNRLTNEFNYIQQDVVETMFEKEHSCISEKIMRPSIAALAGEWLGDLSKAEERKIYAEFLDESDPEPELDDLVDTSGNYTEADKAKANLMLANWKADREKLLDALMDSLDALDDEADFYDWLENNYESEIHEHFEDKEWYPMWATLFEAKSRWMSRDLESKVDELYELGIGVIESSDEFEAMMFISGAGYDFFEAHWIPFFSMLGWIDLTKFPEPDKKLTGCNHCGRTEFTYHVVMQVEVKPKEWAPLKDRGGVYMTQPVLKENQPAKVLRCTYCGTEHAESNFVWEG